MMKIRKKYLLSIIALTFFVIIFSWGLIQDKIELALIEKNKHTTIAKVTKTESRRTSGGVYYTYYFSNKAFNTFESSSENQKKYIDKYYEVNISTEKPSYSRIQLDKEVTDTARIKAAGFKIE